MKVAVIGGGISGLSIAKILQPRHEVVIFEKESRPGGLIKCDIVEGCLFHRTGGHVFNTKRKDVLDWFWNYFDKDENFTKAFRNSCVAMPDGKMIPYPIENHVYYFDETIQQSFIKDLLTISKNIGQVPENFGSFLKGRFGPTLYNLYFKPYNYKVWRRDLNNVPMSWLEGKLPMPSVEEMIYNNMNHIEEKKFVHSSFYYPKCGGSQFIANRLAKDLHIVYDCDIKKISKNNNKWSIEGINFDKVIFCGNIKQLPNLLKCQIDLSMFESMIDNLEYHGTTSVFCEIKENPYSWIYMPSERHKSHRIICTGNFSSNNNTPGKTTATIEFTDNISKEDILYNLKCIPLSPKYITHHYEQYTYPIQSLLTRNMIRDLKYKLSHNNIYLLGRFAEWEYYNMDAAIGAALDLINSI